ncbi:MAG: hypothetical protein A2Y86_04075 [Candidatus Aminicenantes bacterium RBG_13_62_12]|nr:MAG: hypothetical protein A2Y86_04075 [Candidatus Aminicenantes bacterium RBG_13_62_12]
MKITFAAAINCIDGRVQTPVIEYLKRALAVDGVDMITEPGACGVLAENRNEAVVSALKNKVELSVRCHGSRIVAVAGHHDCAAYPKTREEQEAALLAAGRVVGSWNSEIRVMLLWVDEDGSVSEIGS